MSIPPEYRERKFAHSLIKYNDIGFFEQHTINDYIFEIEDIKEIHNYLEQCSKLLNEKVLVITFANRLTLIGIDAMRYISEGPHAGYIKAEAFVIKALTQKLMGNFFLKNLKPIVPVMIFTDKEEGVKWLLGFRGA